MKRRKNDQIKSIGNNVVLGIEVQNYETVFLCKNSPRTYIISQREQNISFSRNAYLLTLFELTYKELCITLR